jgi:GNAT superfamily N-acetyltransferase
MTIQGTFATAVLTDRMTIARAGPGDERLIAAVLRDNQGWVQVTGSDQWQHPFPVEWIAGAIARAEFWIAWKLGRPVGVVRLLGADPLFWGDRDDGSALYLHTLAVPRTRDGRRYGRAILEWAAAETRARGRWRLRLDCAADNPARCADYESAGFRPCGPSLIGGEAMMLFELPLADHR